MILKQIKICLTLLIIACLTITSGIPTYAVSIDPFQRFFIEAMTLPEQQRDKLNEVLVPLINKDIVITDAIVAAAAQYLTAMNKSDIKSVLTIYSHRSEGNQGYIRDMITYGMIEMPEHVRFPALTASFNELFTGSSEDMRGVNFFATILYFARLYSLNKAKLCKNGDPQNTIAFYLDPVYSGQLNKMTMLFNFMPTVDKELKKYEGATSFERLLKYAQSIINSKATETRAFKEALTTIGVFQGEVFPYANRAVLEPLINTAAFINDNAVEGSLPHNVKIGSKAALFNALNTARAVYNDINASQSAVDEQTTRLDNALNELLKNKITPTPIDFERLARATNENISPKTQVTFNDISENHWALPYVGAMASKDIISGRGDGSFDPGANITRAEFIKLITSALSIVKDGLLTKYTDIKATDWYYKYVTSAEQSGIINNTITSFRPNDPISRQEIATVLSRVLKLKAPDNINSFLIFKDALKIGEVFKPFVSSAVSYGIMLGSPDGSFNPSGNATRAEAAAVMYRLYYTVKAMVHIEN